MAAFEIATGRQVWRTKVEGFKTDHMAMSPDKTKIVVSATTATKAFVLDVATGRVLTSFPTGSYPHGNDYSTDGRYLYNSSIGITSLPSALNGLKGNKTLTIVDTRTYKVLKQYTFPNGIRPAVFSRDNRWMYTQFSYLNGLSEVDLSTGKVTRTVTLPFSAAGAKLAKDSYPQNSAHHGLAFDATESKLCAAGTIDDYTTILRRSDLTATGYVHYPTGSIPYWSTTSRDGASCLVSLSGRNEISVVSFASGRETARIRVGAFPQRERLGILAPEALAGLSRSAG